MEFDVANDILKCAVDECSKDSFRKTFCYAHYMKNWRYGTPTPTFPPRWSNLTGKRFGTLTVKDRVDGAWSCVCDCGETRVASTGELNRGGESNTCGVPGRHLRSDVGYFTAHQRVAQSRGVAAALRCIDCDGNASQWSYRHDDPNELVDSVSFANPVAYSADPDFYDPRCVPCHKSFDLGRINAAMS